MKSHCDTKDVRVVPVVARLQEVLVRILPIALLVLFISVTCARGQVFEVGGGTSTLFQASGASIDIHGPDYTSSLGFGSLDRHFRLGVSLTKKWNGLAVTFGDTVIPFRFPTDVLGGGQFVLGRGIAISKTAGRFTLVGFAGTAAIGLNAPFFRGAQSEGGMGAFLLDTKLMPMLHLFTRAIFSNQQTVINGMEWQPETWVKASVAGGIGVNQGYMASSLTIERPWVLLKSAYVLTGNQFRRIAVQSALYAEPDRGNISVTLHPMPFFNINASHSNLLEPTDTSQPGIRARVDQFSGSASAAQFRFSAALFRSSAQGSSAQGTSVSVGRTFGRAFDASVNLFHSRTEKQSSSTILLSTLRETLSPRLNLLQTITQSGGHTTAAFGGGLLTNPVSVDVSYQTVYSPFGAGKPFRQVLLVNLVLQIFGNSIVNLSSYVAPDGSVKYTTYGKTYDSRGDDGSTMPARFGFPKFIVRGRVVDEEDQPVDGAALRVNGELIFTNSEGDFFVRTKKTKLCSVEVVLDQFLATGIFDIVSQPSSAIPSKEGSETPLVVVLRHHRAQVSNSDRPN